jgi:hypothetical protein
MMIERDRNLNQSLLKLLVLNRAGAPYVLEHFMGVEEAGLIKKLDSMKKLGVWLLFHAPFSVPGTPETIPPDPLPQGPCADRKKAQGHASGT